jgi:hypothetical protein
MNTENILKLLGKRKVMAILNRWIKDQINRALENEYEIVFDTVIYLNEYCFDMYQIDISDGEPYEVDDLFKFVGNKIK